MQAHASVILSAYKRIASLLRNSRNPASIRTFLLLRRIVLMSVRIPDKKTPLTSKLARGVPLLCLLYTLIIRTSLFF